MLAFFNRHNDTVSLDRFNQLPTLYTRYRETIRTDLLVDDLVPLVPVVLELYKHGFLYYQIDWDDFTSWQIPETNVGVLLPDRENMLPVIQHAIDELFTPMAEE